VIFIGWILQLFVAQIDGKFFVDGYDAAGSIEDFLRETSRSFG